MMFYRIAISLVLFAGKCLGQTDAPIVGVLSQEVYSVQQYFPNETFRSYIAASYVKFLESSGARVVPIWIGREEAYYRMIVENTNGILWPGGATWFNESNGYGDAAKILYDIILETNDKGVYYPLWTTCLGMERLLLLAANDEEIRENCHCKKVALPLNFTEGFETSRLFSKAPKEIVEILSEKNVTYNYHHYCFTAEKLKNLGLLNEWRILSTNRDVNGLEFVSSVESKYYPFYGVQFHPEKNPFEFKVQLGIPHTSEAVKISQYFGNFFVDECRKNKHRFKNWNNEQSYLIYNYNPVFTGIKNSSYEQLYMFTDEDNLN